MARAGAALICIVLAAATTVEAQDLEPRAYANTPVGMNFLLLGYGYAHGNVVFDSPAPIQDASATVHSGFLAYARSLGIWGRSAKIDVVLPYAWLSGSATFAGQPQDREVNGLGDPRARFSMLLYGGPALSLEEFEDYQADFIVGASLTVTAPLGQYDQNKLLNIGTHRWSVKPELGFSKTLGPVTLELAPSVTFYTANHDFLGDKTLERDPLYAVQGHLIYRTRFGVWTSLDATYYGGENVTIDGVHGERQDNIRLGGTVAIPINRYMSIKLFGSGGAYARTGGNFTGGGIVYQLRWGGGL